MVLSFVITITAVTIIVTHKKDANYYLIKENLEALTTDESGGNKKTCYYLNVYSDGAPKQLSCDKCDYKYGYGQPVGTCP